MRKSLTLIAAAVLALQATVGKTETLGDALVSAYRTSHLFEQQQATLRATDENVAIALARLRPVIKFISSFDFVNGQRITALSPSGVSWGQSLTNTLELSAQMTLYDFGRGKLGVEIAHQTVLATEEGLKDIEQQVLLGAALAYVDVKLQLELVKVQQSNVDLVAEDLRAAQDRFDVGEVTKTDVSQAEAQLAAARAELAAAEGQLTLARESFKATVGHYPGNLAALPRPPNLPTTVSEAQAIAAKTNPRILSAQYQVVAADRGVDLAKAQFYGDLTGYASIGEDITGIGTSPDGLSSANLNSQRVGMSYSQTLYAGGELSAAYRQALDNQDAARASLQLIAVQVNQNVANAWSTVDVAKASIVAGDQQVAAEQAAYDGVKQEAAVGSRTTLDVLNALQSLLNAQTNRLQAAADLFNGEYALLATMGLATAERLRLNVPLYDPSAYYDAVKTAPATSMQGAKLDKIMKLMGRD